jgi:genome maintenance exonuclease 1
MKWNKKFNYPRSTRSIVEGKRHYDIREEKLPSVTTILSACQSDEKRASLEAWRQRVGPKTADLAKDLAAERGTLMHRYLEAYIDGSGHKDMTPLGEQAETMAKQIIETGLRDLEEVWGTEVTLYYPGLYAGQTDVVGVYDGQPAIIDFKQTNKPKRREWITDYFEQLGAYCMAHNYVYGTKVQSGVILMCSKDFLFQKFEISGREFVRHQHNFLKKIDQFYKQNADKYQIVPKQNEGPDTKKDEKL